MSHHLAMAVLQAVVSVKIGPPLEIQPIHPRKIKTKEIKNRGTRRIQVHKHQRGRQVSSRGKH